ncbi:facilitated trehalose transporter Tret1-like isoform X2 [Adelges cooleyi]|uniref:facilitated trehalose transporter Tret1-like isoform X2 n=1 Tax=Adelges cooleyi TaxID=133065 RepID=UPI00217FE029|nr:facilitated trehalose transporter Tret1-like isoform X2 [Adelges cooleyi]
MSINTSQLRQVYAATAATLGAMLMGMVIGWSSPAVGFLESGNFYSPFPVTKDDTQIYGSIFGIGATIGALPAGSVANIIGRCMSMVVFEIIFIVGWICLAIPRGVWMLNLGRTLQGIGAGALCAVIPMYVGEISEPNIRGRLGAIFEVLSVFGVLYVYIVGAYFNYMTFCALCGIWSLIHLIGVLFIPESPYYYLSNDMEEKASLSLKKLRRENADTARELDEIKKAISDEKSNHYTFSQVISSAVNRKSLFIGISCMFFQQACGCSVTLFYMNDIFASTGSAIDPNTAAIIVGFVMFFMTFVTMALLDKAGRKILLVISACLMGASHMCLGIYYLIYKNSPEAAKSITWLPLLSLAVYVTGYSTGFGAVPWVVMGEIFSNELKPYGTGIATAMNWILVFFTTYISKNWVRWVGNDGMFFTFSGFCILGALFALLIMPETKNRSLAEIQLDLMGEKKQLDNLT